MRACLLDKATSSIIPRLDYHVFNRNVLKSKSSDTQIAFWHTRAPHQQLHWTRHRWIVWPWIQGKKCRGHRHVLRMGKRNISLQPLQNRHRPRFLFWFQDIWFWIWLKCAMLWQSLWLRKWWMRCRVSRERLVWTCFLDRLDQIETARGSLSSGPDPRCEANRWGNYMSRNTYTLRRVCFLE